MELSWGAGEPRHQGDWGPEPGGRGMGTRAVTARQDSTLYLLQCHGLGIFPDISFPSVHSWTGAVFWEVGRDPSTRGDSSDD